MAEENKINNKPEQEIRGVFPLSSNASCKTVLITREAELMKKIISDMIFIAYTRVSAAPNRHTYFPRPPVITALICNIDWFDPAVSTKVNALVDRWTQLPQTKVASLPLTQHHYSHEEVNPRDGLKKTMKYPPTLVKYSGEFGPIMRRTLAEALFTRGLFPIDYFIIPPNEV